MVPHDLRAEVEERPIVYKINAIWFAKQVEGAAIFELRREDTDQFEVELLDVADPVPMVCGDTIRAVTDNEINAAVINLW